MPKQAIKKISKSHERHILDLIKNSDPIGLAAFLASLCDLKVDSWGSTLSAERVAESMIVLSRYYGDPLDTFFSSAGDIIARSSFKLWRTGAISDSLGQRIEKFAKSSGDDVRSGYDSAIEELSASRK